MTQQQLFDELAALCNKYEKLLNQLDYRSRLLISGSLQERVHEQQLYYSRNYREKGHHVQLAIPPATKDGVRLIRELREKRVVIHGRRILRENINSIRKALHHLTSYDPERYAGRYLLHDGISLPDRDFLPGQLNMSKWIRDTKEGNFKVNPYHPEQRQSETKSGQLVRSKSEMLWHDILDEEGFIFRYDSELHLKNGRVIYADFIILHLKERRLIIIEHFGRMHETDYAIKNMLRLQDYADSGYILGRDLFFTLEAPGQPLTRSQVYATLRRIGF